MSYRIALARSAQRALEELSERHAAAILEFILGPLRENPHRVGGQLHGARAGQHSGRVGLYRVIYRIDEQARVVRVLRVAHRADAYRGWPAGEPRIPPAATRAQAGRARRVCREPATVYPPVYPRERHQAHSPQSST